MNGKEGRNVRWSGRGFKDGKEKVQDTCRMSGGGGGGEGNDCRSVLLGS